MIGTDEMSSTGMDISESFRPEDLSKTDFFDFVSADDINIGIDVGVGIGGSSSVNLHTHSSHPHHHSLHERITASGSMTHDGGGGRRSGGTNESGGSTSSASSTRHSGNNNNTNDPTLQGYEFSILEDLDHYWSQQQQQFQAMTQSPSSHPAHHNNPNSPNQPHMAPTHNSSNNSGSSATSTSGVSSISQPSSAGTNASSLDNNHDGQIYTLTVLNGNEPWLKREPDSQLTGTLDLDSLLNNFTGYIKSEYPYDDSGFSTDGTKDLNGEANGISMSPHLGAHHSLATMPSGGSGQSLPSLVTTIASMAGEDGSGGTNSNNVCQQLAQFQNNNNDWHMVDHNAEQNSAESLLRSALQGKGYSKGLNMQNGITLLPSSPSVKDDDMHRILFQSDADALSFADSTLNSQIFDDTQTATHNAHLLMQHSPVTQNGANSCSAGGNGVSSISVDDMFLSLENAFNDDLKRITNEVYCNSTNDYANSSDMMMQISPSLHQHPQMHSPATSPTGMGPSKQSTTPGLHLQAASPQAAAAVQQQQQQKSPASQTPQPLKPEVSTSTTIRITTKSTKKYKRTHSNSSSSNNNNNNNNPSVANHNNNNSSGMNNNNSNGTPNSNSSGNASSSSPTHCNGQQRKERSLHYCSICSKGFKDKYSVNVHIRTHTGEKPFACSLCGKSFRQKAHLAKHYQTHIAQKNNGHIVKGGSSKHHRNNNNVNVGVGSVGAVSGGGASMTISVGPTPVVSSSQRQLSVGHTSALGTSGNLVGLPSLNRLSSATGPPVGSSATTVLPPANGLLANR